MAERKKLPHEDMLTIYGRQAVKESLQHPDTRPYRLHLATSNKPSAQIDEIRRLAEDQGAEICYHTRLALSRISRNGRQDQGIAVDIVCPGFADYQSFKAPSEPFELLAVDRVTNPVNLGMIIRSVAASPMQGIIIPKRGCARLDALVVKASAGNLFRARIVTCQGLAECLTHFRSVHGCLITGLTASAGMTLPDLSHGQQSRIFVLGNESEGLGESITELCDEQVAIPMNHQVESLNVAVTASLVAFRSVFRPPTRL